MKLRYEPCLKDQLRVIREGAYLESKETKLQSTVPPRCHSFAFHTVSHSDPDNGPTIYRTTGAAFFTTAFRAYKVSLCAKLTNSCASRYHYCPGFPLINAVQRINAMDPCCCPRLNTPSCLMELRSRVRQASGKPRSISDLIFRHSCE